GGVAAPAARALRGVQPRLRPRHAVRPADGREHRGDPRLPAPAGRLGLRPPARARPPRGATGRVPRPPRLAGDPPTGDGMNETDTASAGVDRGEARGDERGASRGAQRGEPRGPTGIVMLNL